MCCSLCITDHFTKTLLSNNFEKLDFPQQMMFSFYQKMNPNETVFSTFKVLVMFKRINREWSTSFVLCCLELSMRQLIKTNILYEKLL